MVPTLLVNGPIPCNPTSESYEGYLGDVNSRPNEFGYVTIRISNYRKLIIPSKVRLDANTELDVAFTNFDAVWGEAVEDVVVGDQVVTVRGGEIQ